MDTGRAHTAIVMAKCDLNIYRSYLLARAVALRKEADEIEAFVASYGKETDEWHALISAERDAEVHS